MQTPPSNSFRPPAPSEAPSDSSPFVRAGTTLFAAAVASTLAAIPPVLRASASLAGAAESLGAWLFAAAVIVLPMTFAVAVLRGARIGLRAFGGEGSGPRFAGAVVWTALFGAWLAVFGAALRATTHHHALAGATFAVVSTVAGLAVAVVAARVSTMLCTCTTRVRESLVVVVTIGFALGVLALAAYLGRGPSADAETGTAALLADGLAFAMASILASRPEIAERRGLALAGLPLAAIVVLAGLLAERSAPAASTEVEAHAPIYAPFVRALAKR